MSFNESTLSSRLVDDIDYIYLELSDIGYDISVIKPRYDTVEVCLSNRKLFNWFDINEYFDRSLSIVSLYYCTKNGLSSADPRYNRKLMYLTIHVRYFDRHYDNLDNKDDMYIKFKDYQSFHDFIVNQNFIFEIRYSMVF